MSDPRLAEVRRLRAKLTRQQLTTARTRAQLAEAMMAAVKDGVPKAKTAGAAGYSVARLYQLEGRYE